MSNPSSCKTIKNIGKKLKKHLKSPFLLVSLLVFTFPHLTASQALTNKNYIVGPVREEAIKPYNSGQSLPEIPDKQPKKTMNIMVTAYSSEPAQTDDTPFITAFGTHVRDGIVATNFLPKGTIVRFPEAYGDKEFVVEDRMNKRYYYHMDIWMAEKQEAINFGAKVLKMEIL